MLHGGKREGAGRKVGSKNKSTLEQFKVAEAFNQRILNKADELFNAQLQLATGSAKVFRVDEETDDKGKTKRVHVHVTDPDEIKALLDEYDGAPGQINGVYYYFADILPDNRAIDSLLNRGLGKPTENLKIDVRDIDAEIERRLANLATGSQAETFGETQSERVN